jgi:hypothetical protein
VGHSVLTGALLQLSLYHPRCEGGRTETGAARNLRSLGFSELEQLDDVPPDRTSAHRDDGASSILVGVPRWATTDDRFHHRLLNSSENPNIALRDYRLQTRFRLKTANKNSKAKDYYATVKRESVCVTHKFRTLIILKLAFSYSASLGRFQFCGQGVPHAAQDRPLPSSQLAKRLSGTQSAITALHLPKIDCLWL